MRSTSVEGSPGGNGRLIKDAHDRSDQLFNVELLDADDGGLPLMFALLEVMGSPTACASAGYGCDGTRRPVPPVRMSGRGGVGRKMSGQKRFRSGMIRRGPWRSYQAVPEHPESRARADSGAVLGPVTRGGVGVEGAPSAKKVSVEKDDGDAHRYEPTARLRRRRGGVLTPPACEDAMLASRTC